MEHQYEAPYTVEQYKQGLMHLELKEAELQILQLQYSAPDHTISSPAVANILGYKSHLTVNSLYGQLGRRLADVLGGEPPDAYEDADGSPLWLSYLSQWKYHGNSIVWIMFAELATALEEIGLVTLLPEEISNISEFPEGSKRQIIVNAYERNPKARQKCIEYHGTECYICGFSFGEIYGDVGAGFIHVHHLRPISEIKAQYHVDPVRDLIPVCPNCHAIIHRRNPPYTVEEVQDMLRNQSKNEY